MSTLACRPGYGKCLACAIGDSTGGDRKERFLPNKTHNPSTLVVLLSRCIIPPTGPGSQRANNIRPGCLTFHFTCYCEPGSYRSMISCWTPTASTELQLLKSCKQTKMYCRLDVVLPVRLVWSAGIPSSHERERPYAQPELDVLYSNKYFEFCSRTDTRPPA